MFLIATMVCQLFRARDDALLDDGTAKTQNTNTQLFKFDLTSTADLSSISLIGTTTSRHFVALYCSCASYTCSCASGMLLGYCCAIHGYSDSWIAARGLAPHSKEEQDAYIQRSSLPTVEQLEALRAARDTTKSEQPPASPSRAHPPVLFYHACCDASQPSPMLAKGQR